MSTEEITEEIQVAGSLLSFNVFEEKLMRNFYIINTRLKKLDDIHELDLKMKAMQKQFKFLSMKMETMAEKIPKEGSTVSRNDVKIMAKDTFFDILNSKDDKLKNSKFSEQIRKQIQSLKAEIGRVGSISSPSGLQRRDSSTLLNKASFTAGQVLLQDGSGNKKIPKESLEECLEESEMNVVNQYMGVNQGQNFLEDINRKFEDVYQKIEEVKLGKMFNEYGEKDIEKFQRYEQYEQKSQQAARKNKEKPIRLDGIKKQNVKGELLKNELFAEYQKSQLLKGQANKQPQKKNMVGKSSNTLTNFYNDKRQIKIIEDGEEKEKMKRARSIKKLQRIERRLKVDDIKDLNSVLREIQLRIEGKVSHQLVMGIIQDLQQKIQILRITKDKDNDINELRKMVYSIESRLQAIIIFLQNSVSEDDALLVKKQWTCVSCDKGLEKYGGKVGQHLNWQGMNPKKLSPTKAGAFGQTGQLANKIRNIMQNQKGSE